VADELDLAELVTVVDEVVPLDLSGRFDRSAMASAD
jgi:hypothetical protein